MAQKWAHSPPSTNVGRVQILWSTPYVGWVCFWFFSLLREVFLRVLRFFPPPQKPTFPNSNSTRNQVDEQPFSECAALNRYVSYKKALDWHRPFLLDKYYLSVTVLGKSFAIRLVELSCEVRHDYYFYLLLIFWGRRLFKGPTLRFSLSSFF